MQLVAPGVWQITGFPRHAINAYLTGDTLVDAGTRYFARRILAAIERHPIAEVVLTHCHPDHQGSVHQVCQRLGVPLACHAGDAAAMEGCQPMAPQSSAIRLSTRVWAGPPYQVTRVLAEGDIVAAAAVAGATAAGFQVLHTPGHTPGHVIFFRESDRVAIVGDVARNMSFVTLRTGLREPPRVFTVDQSENRRSIRRLAELRPATILFGHGPPLYDAAEPLAEFASRLE